jgi:subtilisin family serine protease
MHIRSLIFSCFLLSFLFSEAQQTKLTFELAKLSADKKHASEIVAVLIKGDPLKVRTAVDKVGGAYLYSIGTISSVKIPVKSLGAFSAYSFVSRMEQGSIRLHPLNDTMVYLNNIVPVNNGVSPLPQKYNGSGVVCGFIDTGIDFSHPDFKDSLGKSRIKFIWDQNQPLAANTPQPYNYGQEWNNLQIDSGKCTEADSNQWGHGTRVAGTAAGNGLAVNRYAGAAPKADIIMVAVGFGVSAPVISDAANYIFSKADQMGKPCVINCSLGSEIGSHDGLDLETQVIDSLVMAKNGRVFVAAAGNSGDTPLHLTNTLHGDSSGTWVRLTGNDSANSYTTVDIQIYGDTSQLKNLRFALAADRNSPSYVTRARSKYYTYASNPGVIVYDSLKANGNLLADYQSYQQIYGKTFMIEFYVHADTSYSYRLLAAGSGKFDAWSYDFVATGIPSPTVFPAAANYKLPDTDETVETGFQCSPHVISVANYVNKNCFTDQANKVICDTNFVFRPRRLAPSSSHGPTRTGGQKPDIAATGDYVISCFVVSLRRWFDSTQIAKGGLHMPGGGTSQASPVIAGIAALYLQQNPNASHLQVKNAILCSGHPDMYTPQTLPDYKWGYGKVDAFMALTGCAPMQVHESIKGSAGLEVWPNPIDESATVRWEDIPGDGELVVFDLVGQEISHYVVKDGTKSLTLQRGTLKPGIYFVTLKIKGTKALSRKIAVR